MSPVMSLILVAVVVLQCVEVRSSEVTVGDNNWYNNNKPVIQQSIQFTDKLRQQINNNHQQQQQQQPQSSLFSDTPTLRCEFDIKSCVPILIQQNVDGSTVFNRSWSSYRAGFSGSNGNYWIGNELLHQLTKDGRYKLRIDLQFKSNNAWYWAEYGTFTVYSEATQYEVHMASYTGNTGYDAFVYHDRMKFSTYDRDNDQRASRDGDCGKFFGGGFWYNNCFYFNPNGLADNTRLYTPPTWTHMKTSRMWLLCR